MKAGVKLRAMLRFRFSGEVSIVVMENSGEGHDLHESRLVSDVYGLDIFGGSLQLPVCGPQFSGVVGWWWMAVGDGGRWWRMVTLR